MPLFISNIALRVPTSLQKETMRLKLTIAYDGRPYSGWATQPSSQTIQDKLHAALAAIAKQEVKIQGSGRTDTGVHADAQIAHFDNPEGIDMNPYNWVPALNTKLPKIGPLPSLQRKTFPLHIKWILFPLTIIFCGWWPVGGTTFAM